MADLTVSDNTAINDVALDVAQNAVSRGLGGLWGRVQKVGKYLNNKSRQDIVARVKQTTDAVRNISREDIANHVKKAGDNLRNMSREDVLFLSLSMGAGFGAKAGAVGLMGLAGVATGGTGLAALGIVVVGGAAASLAKKGVKHLRAVKDGSTEKFFTRETMVSRNALVSAAFGVGISALTFGASEWFEHATGHSIGETLGKAFHKVAGSVSEKFSDLMPNGSSHAPTHNNIPKPIGHISAPSAPVAQAIPESVPKLEVKAPEAPVLHATHENMSKPKVSVPTQHPAPMVKAAPVVSAPVVPKLEVKVPEAPVLHAAHENVSKPKVSVPTPPPASVAEVAPVAPAPAAVPDLKATIQAQALVEKLRYDYEASFGSPAPESMTAPEMAEQLYPKNPQAYMDAASDMAQHNLESGRSQFSADYKAINEAPAPTPAPEIAPAVPQAAPNANAGIPVSTASPQELAAEAIAKAKLAVTQEDLTNAYTMERLHQMVKDTTGIDAPADAIATDLAKQISPNNSDTMIKGIQQQAPQLKVENLAASCTTEIPKERSTVNVIKTLCYKFKEHMSGNDIAIVDNANEAVPQNGLRLLYRRAVSAMGRLVPVETTNNFIAQNITGQNGVVQEMTEAKFGL